MTGVTFVNNEFYAMFGPNHVGDHRYDGFDRGGNSCGIFWPGCIGGQVCLEPESNRRAHGLSGTAFFGQGVAKGSIPNSSFDVVSRCIGATRSTKQHARANRTSSQDTNERFPNGPTSQAGGLKRCRAVHAKLERPGIQAVNRKISQYTILRRPRSLEEEQGVANGNRYMGHSA